MITITKEYIKGVYAQYPLLLLSPYVQEAYHPILVKEYVINIRPWHCIILMIEFPYCDFMSELTKNKNRSPYYNTKLSQDNQGTKRHHDPETEMIVNAIIRLIQFYFPNKEF